MSIVMDGSVQRKNNPALKTSPKSRFMNQDNPSLKSVEVETVIKIGDNLRRFLQTKMYNEKWKTLQKYFQIQKQIGK